MKIKFKNKNYLEPIKSTDIKRSYRVDKLKEFYLKYPDVFLENYFDIELLSYQRLLIRIISKVNKENIKMKIKQSLEHCEVVEQLDSITKDVKNTANAVEKAMSELKKED